MGVPAEEKERDWKIIFKEIMTESVPYLMKKLLLMDSEISTKPKYDKHKESHT